MTRTKRYSSDALRSLGEVAEDLHDVGVIDKATMRHFDLSCLTPVEPLLGAVVNAIKDVSSILKERLTIPQEPVVPPVVNESSALSHEMQARQDRETLLVQAQQDRARLLSNVRQFLGLR